MFTQERQQKILNDIYKHKKVSVNSLATKFSVSKETIRKDLNVLSKNKTIIRTYGGAFIAEKK